MKSLTPGDQVLKIVNEELRTLMGEEAVPLNMNENGTTVILFAGLQGSGKTTHAGKLANYIRKKYNARPLLIAADVYRPAAVNQLVTLAKQLNVKKAIAKVNSSVMTNMIDKLPIDSIVSPKHIIANQIIGYVRAKSHDNENDAVQTLYRLVDDQVEALEFVASSSRDYYGIPLQQLSIKKGVLVAAILRNGVLTVPKGNTTIEQGDHIMVVAKNSKIERLSDIFED
jgi:hypothetical protein